MAAHGAAPSQITSLLSVVVLHTDHDFGGKRPPPFLQRGNREFGMRALILRLSGGSGGHRGGLVWNLEPRKFCKRPLSSQRRGTSNICSARRARSRRKAEARHANGKDRNHGGSNRNVWAGARCRARKKLSVKGRPCRITSSISQGQVAGQGQGSAETTAAGPLL